MCARRASSNMLGEHLSTKLDHQAWTETLSMVAHLIRNYDSVHVFFVLKVMPYGRK